jgi:phosphoribosylformylglycinamidine synthase
MDGVDCVILPGGFSHGDYLRPGAMARFAPIMESVLAFARAGGLVLGLCNGFQILCEAGLLPGALVRNRSLHFVCRQALLRVEETDTPFTGACSPGDLLALPIKHGSGCYVADESTLRRLEERRQVVFRYADPAGRTSDEANPNGSLNNIAGIVNEERNVLGMMPHPEHACERLLGSEDGLQIFRSVRAALGRSSEPAATSVPPGL